MKGGWLEVKWLRGEPHLHLHILIGGGGTQIKMQTHELDLVLLDILLPRRKALC